MNTLTIAIHPDHTWSPPERAVIHYAPKPGEIQGTPITVPANGYWVDVADWDPKTRQHNLDAGGKHVNWITFEEILAPTDDRMPGAKTNVRGLGAMMKVREWQAKLPDARRILRPFDIGEDL